MTEENKDDFDAITLNRLILRSIVDHAIVTLDKNGIVTSWNHGAETILGWTEEEIVGQSADKFFTPEDVARDRPETEMRVARENGRAEDERWHQRKDGSRFWGSGLLMPMLPETLERNVDRAATSGFVKIFRDRTFQQNANTKIALLEQRAALVMQRSETMGVYEINVADELLIADADMIRLHSLPSDTAEAECALDAYFEQVHPEDIDRVRLTVLEAIDSGTDLDVTYRTNGDGIRPRWIHSQAAVQTDGTGCVARLSGIAVDITEQRVQAHMQDMRLQFLDQVRYLDDPDEIAGLASRTIAETLYAVRAGHGYMLADGDTIDVRSGWTVPGAISVVGHQKFSAFGEFLDALEQGKTVVIEDALLDPRVANADQLVAVQARSLVNIPLVEKGRLRAVLFVNDARARTWTEAELTFMQAIFERTYAAIDRIRSEAERDIMAAELAHRMKNMLTIAQVVVTRTLNGTNDIETARTAIAARLGALSDAQDVLTRKNQQDAEIRDVIEAVFRPYTAAADRILVSGPILELDSRRVLGLSLGLHELATNAAKYGALSNNVGRIDIKWAVDSGVFSLTWRESGGPPVCEPNRRGFGSTILNRIVGGYFDGATDIAYDPDGLRFELTGRV